MKPFLPLFCHWHAIMVDIEAGQKIISCSWHYVTHYFILFGGEMDTTK